MISLIAAMDKNRVIGSDGGIPWHLPSDLQHFKAMTLGKPMIMGRATFDSIGKALPGRRNIVLSRQAGVVCEGCDVYSTLDDALASTDPNDEVMIIGGATLYKLCLPKASRMYLTLIDTSVPGDTYFPEWTLDEWRVTSQEPGQENGLSFVYQTLDRKSDET